MNVRPATRRSKGTGLSGARQAGSQSIKPASARVWQMRKTSVRELHVHTSALVREAAEGGVIVIERRGVPVAELRPLSNQSQMPAAEKDQIFLSMKEVWERMPLSGDSTRTIAEDRDR